MTDEQWKAGVARMSLPQLLEEILDHPQYLADSYYEDMGEALRARGQELIKGVYTWQR